MKPKFSQCCEVTDCDRDGERAHLITQANLEKSKRSLPQFYLILCRKHHHEQHQIGIESFCIKYGFMMELERARRVLRNLRAGKESGLRN